MSTQLTTRDFFAQKHVQSKFAEMLGKRSTQFLTSVMQITNSNDLLKKATPESIYGAAVTAAVLDLPIQNNLGFAYIVPFGGQAQFQLGYKGLIQLALRSGQFKNIAVAEIYEGQIVSENPLTGYVFDFSKKTSDKVVGYAAYFSLLNGFEKTEYMSREKLDAHGKKFSQTYKKGFGVWKDDFDSMAKKTVLKLTLSKYAPLSVEMQKAITFDQAVTHDGEVVEFVDNTETIEASVEDIKEAGAKLTGELFNENNK